MSCQNLPTTWKNVFHSSNNRPHNILKHNAFKHLVQ